MPSTKPHGSPPLPLQEIAPWVSSSCLVHNSSKGGRKKNQGDNEANATQPTTVLEWLREGDAQAAAWQQELEANGADQIVNFFAMNNNNDNDDDDDDSSVDSNVDFEGVYGRIRVWQSSKDNVDGVGSKFRGGGGEEEASDNNVDDGGVKVTYLISEAWEGYGDILWASSRHLSNQFADPTKCRELLGINADAENDDNTHHPLQRRTVLELGAGCAVPSLVAMKCGTKAVVATDLDDANRIRSIAEAMQRNFPTVANNNNAKARAHPFRWEEPDMITGCAQVLKELLNEKNDDDNTPIDDPSNTATLPTFDVICATDCLFIIHLHEHLIRTLDELLNPIGGVAIFCFCIHASYSKAEQVWGFVDKVRDYKPNGAAVFEVETLPSVQCTPPKVGMPSEQGLVHTLRIRKV